MRTDVLRFTRVVRRFGDVSVLQGLSAEIPLSGITFVVGRSGAGKSVLCRLAVGLLRPNEGEVELLGQRVDTLPERELLPLRRQAPYLVQGPALLGWLTVEQNVALAAPALSSPERQAILERVGLAPFAVQHPSALGPGLQKRVAIARALALQPRYLFLDEPTTGLDKRASRQVKEVLLRLKGEGFGALVVSHDYSALESTADRVLLIARGQVAFSGTAEEFTRSREAVADG